MSDGKVKLAIQIIPSMPTRDVVETIRVAEELGYTYCLMADEGFMPDVYVTLGIAAEHTRRVMLGPVTNGYTRHPAATAAALATLHEATGGRAFVSLVAGGSMVLNPMSIERQAPVTVMRETIEILRLLWSGETVSYQGQRYQLNNAQIHMGAQAIPIWMAVRGSHLLKLAGELADAVVMVVKSDVETAVKLVEQGSAKSGRRPLRVYLDSMAFTEDMVSQARTLFAYVLMDTPPRQLAGLGLTSERVTEIAQAMGAGGPAAATKLITPEMLKRYQIAGTREECVQALEDLVKTGDMDVFMLNATSGDLKENIHLMEQTRSLVEECGKEVAN